MKSFDVLFFFVFSAIYEKILEHLQRYYDFKPGNTPRRKVRQSIERRIHFVF